LGGRNCGGAQAQQGDDPASYDDFSYSHFKAALHLTTRLVGATFYIQTSASNFTIPLGIMSRVKTGMFPGLA